MPKQGDSQVAVTLIYTADNAGRRWTVFSALIFSGRGIRQWLHLSGGALVKSTL